MTPHIPVLLDEVLDSLLPAERIIDGTLGAGGHTRALLNSGAGAVLAFDADSMAIDIARANLAGYEDRVTIVHDSYANMAEHAKHIGWDSVDGILLDLGLSSMQLDTPERGFAFMHDAPLDMRFDQNNGLLTAADLVNTSDEYELADVFFKYGEEPQSRKIARAIIAARPIFTTRELAAAVEKAIPRHEKIHPATRVFQALRIAVNGELETVERALPIAIGLLKPGGRLAVISFHSLEDRIVKQVFKLASTDCICPPKVPICVCGHHASVRLVTRKPVVPSDDEIANNPRSRSAKLRVVEKANDELVR